MNCKITLLKKVKILTSILLLPIMMMIVADDTEVFFAEQSSVNKPNLLFVMDVSGSMDQKIDPSDANSKTRLETMQGALRTVLSSAPKNLNVGIMEFGELQRDRYSGQYPSGISFPVSDIEALALPIVRDSLTIDEWNNVKWWKSKIPEPAAERTVRDYISDITDLYFQDSWYKKKYQGKTDEQIALPRFGNTPIVDALYEAARYFRGDKVYFGYGAASEHKEGWQLARSAVPSSYEGDPIYWDENRCKEGITFSTTDKSNWTRWSYGFKDKYFAERWDGGYNWSNRYKRWRDYKCPTDLSNPNAAPYTTEACKTHESCTYEMKGYQPERQARAAVQGVWTCDLERYGPWYCPVAEKTDENGTIICPGGRKRDRIYPDGCYWKGSVAAVTYRPEIPAEKYWTCKIPRCSGALTDTPKYISPIKNTCQNNFIVLMSDGKPQYSRWYDSNGNRDGTNKPGYVAERLRKGNSNVILADKSDPTIKFNNNSCKDNPKPSGYASGKCGPELTQFLATSDQQADIEGKQVVNTFAIGFGLDPAEPKADEYLESLVTTDVDPDTGRKLGYFVAQDEVTLASAFDKIVKKIGVTTDSLAASGYSVNIKSGVAHENKIYIPVFRRKETPTWSGNLKKFELKLVDGVRKIVDANGKVAMTESGVFKKDARDFWSNTNDGAKVEAGGVVNLLKDADQRKLLTNSSSGHTLENIELSNTAIDYSVLGLEGADKTPEHREKLIKFIRGERYDTDSGGYVQRKHMGDMMHSDPVVITYNKDYEAAGVEGGQVLYIGTNEGYLHAFDTVTGNELFAFMPKILLKNIDRQYKNSNEDKHVYGVDGPISVWNKIDKDDASKNKHYIYFGLRRGGRAFYALDVTDPFNPKLQWKLNRHTTFGGKKVFEKIGQTWSRADHVKIRMDKKGTMKDVVIFSGGYDINQDFYADKSLNAFKDPTDESKGRIEKKPNDNIGKNIFMVDAIGGPKVFSWSMSDKTKNATLLKHSTPSGVRSIDINGDGAIDRIYFADVGGNVWRLEMPTGPDFDITTKNSTKLIKFASLGDGSGSVEGRKFYSEPDVSLLTHKGKNYLAVSIGSGYRAHPLYEGGKENNFYVLIDKNVYSELETDTSKPEHFKTIKSANLEKLKATFSGGAFGLNTGRLSSNKNVIDLINETDGSIRGWALELPSKGEKVLATSITRDGKLIFTSLAPNTEGEVLDSADECGSPRSQGRAYVLDLLTSKAVVDLNHDGSKPNDEDIMMSVTDNTIPNSPQAIFPEPVCDESTKKCSQPIGIRIDKKASALMDEPLDYLEPRYWNDPVMKGGQ